MLMALDFLFVILALATWNVEGGSIDDSFLKSFKHKLQKMDAIVEFPEVLPTVLTNPALVGLEGDARRSKIVNLLQEATSSMQQPIMASITNLGFRPCKVTAFWVANTISIEDARLSALIALAATPGNFTILKAQTVDLGQVITEEVVSRSSDTKITYQWGVNKIGAPIAFQHNIKGKGVIVGIIDTGVRATHEALKANYKNDKYSWKDAINSKAKPYDDSGHGTHCAGIAVGTANGIGVAPGAKWIACKGLDSQGAGKQRALTACAQFMACPKSSSGTCSEFPNVVSNSWGGGIDKSFLNSVINTWTSMNIVPVFSIGNTGSKCGTASSPGDQPNVISVGSTDSDDTVSSFSGRGSGGAKASRPDLKGPTKPEVVAPGRNIVSASHRSDTGYTTLSGTSQAAPHVAGAAALILSTDLKLGWKAVRDRLEQNTDRNTNAVIKCKLASSPNYPNNEYGFGRISVSKALHIS